jgi:hypothetical protein
MLIIGTVHSLTACWIAHCLLIRPPPSLLAHSLPCPLTALLTHCIAHSLSRPLRNQLREYGDTPRAQACTNAATEASINAAQRFQTVNDTFHDTLLQVGHYPTRHREVARGLGGGGGLGEGRGLGVARGMHEEVHPLDVQPGRGLAVDVPPTDVQPGVEDATDAPALSTKATRALGGMAFDRSPVGVSGIAGLDWSPAARPQPRRPVELL